MKILIPWFKVNGTSSYPAGVTSVREQLSFNGSEYWIGQGEALAETGDDNYADYENYITSPVPTPIRTISTGAMQRRFTIPEEVFIESDPSAKVIKSRLLNASYCDLDYQDTIDGVTYICGVLEVGGVIGDAATRITELLVDGTEQEKYP